MHGTSVRLDLRFLLIASFLATVTGVEVIKTVAYILTFVLDFEDTC